MRLPGQMQGRSFGCHVGGSGAWQDRGVCPEHVTEEGVRGAVHQCPAAVRNATDWWLRTARMTLSQSWSHMCSRGGSFQPLPLLEALGAPGLVTTPSGLPLPSHGFSPGCVCISPLCLL